LEPNWNFHFNLPDGKKPGLAAMIAIVFLKWNSSVSSVEQLLGFTHCLGGIELIDAIHIFGCDLRHHL